MGDSNLSSMPALHRTDGGSADKDKKIGHSLALFGFWERGVLADGIPIVAA